MEKAPQIKNSANKVDTDMAYRYRRAHQLEFVKQTDGMKKRIEAAKANPDKSDREVDAFVKSVIGIAESEREL